MPAAERTWVEDHRWVVPARHGRCRFRLRSEPCPRVPVASVNRGRGGHEVWWSYCERHLYGRQVVGGKVMVGVAPDSLAARRGWVD